MGRLPGVCTPGYVLSPLPGLPCGVPMITTYPPPSLNQSSSDRMRM